MRNRVYRAFTVAVLFQLSLCIVQADDLLTFKNGKEMRCKVLSYKGGKLTVRDSNGKETTGTISVLSEIAFDIPPLPASPNQEQERISMEKLNTFPEEYVGKRLVFAGCELHQELHKTEFADLYGLSVESKGGEYISGIVLGTDTITFVVRKVLAKEISDDIEGGYVWPNCTLVCTVEKRGRYFLAIVDRIDIYNAGGRFGKVYKAQEGNANQ